MSFITLQGKYADAESLHGQAAEIWEKALGSEHPTVAVVLNHQALSLEMQASGGVVCPGFATKKACLLKGWYFSGKYMAPRHGRGCRFVETASLSLRWRVPG